MNLNLKELIAGPPSRLRYVNRYSTCRVFHPENVAEHSYYVTFYCWMIAKWYNSKAYREALPHVNVEKLLERALIHDLEEAVSGDFPRRFKHSTPELQQTLHVASLEAFKQAKDSFWRESAMQEQSEGSLTWSWVNSKDGSLEGRILEFADFIAVLGYLWEEIRGGVSKLGDHVQEMVKYYRKFDDPKFKFLLPLIQQAGDMMMELGLLSSSFNFKQI